MAATVIPIKARSESVAYFADKRRSRAQPEEAIQRAVIKHLKARASQGAVWWHTPNSSKLGGKRTSDGVPFEAIRNKHLGVRAGVSDICCLYQSRFYALELKSDDGRPTEAQMQFISGINAAGGYGCIAHGLNAALKTLETWGILRGTA